jgi:hypothetical protein
MTGSCLCTAVGFEIKGQASPIELCQCVKCQRAYGSAFAATLYVRAEDFAWSRGQHDVTTWDAPIEQSPPAYRHSFCRSCGSPLPLLFEAFGLVEVPVASLEEPVEGQPAYRMYESQRAPWSTRLEELSWHREAAPITEKVVRVLF